MNYFLRKRGVFSFSSDRIFIWDDFAHQHPSNCLMGLKLNTTNYNNNDLRKRFELELKELFEFKNFIYKVIFIHGWFFYSWRWKILFSTKRSKAYSTFSVLVDRSYIKSFQVINYLKLISTYFNFFVL